MPSNTRRLLLAAVAALTCASLAPAQQQQQQPVQQQVSRGGLNPDSFYGKESFQGVSVRDSLDAIKKIEDARRMERLEDWNKAADWYQEVIEKYGQYVVPNGTDANNNIRQYTGIERPVQEQLAKWPKSGLDAYRNRYGGVAATMLEGARQDDRETLAKVMKLYFVTEAGKLAGIRLVDLLLEDGDFAEAGRIGDRLLDWHPNLVVERPKVLFRTALAYHLAGDEKRSGERTEQLRTKFAGAVGTLYGKDIVLADALERMRQTAPPVAVVTGNGGVMYAPGGDASRSLITTAKAFAGARLAFVDIVPPPVVTGRNAPPPVEIDAMGNARRVSGADQGSQGILPVSEGGELYFQDGSRLYAVSLQSGVPLPGWQQSYPQANGQYAVHSFGYGRNHQHTVTLTDDAVLAVMGYGDRMAQFGGSQTWGNDKRTRLVCLDRATGREKWKPARPQDIPEENLRSLEFSGSPLVVGDNVYVIGRGGKNMSAEDCYVVCYDLNAGTYKWSCFIASSTNAAAGFGGQFASADTLSHLAYSSGRVYVLTNVGACAALDAYSGTVSWLNIYPRDDQGNMNPNMGWRGMRGTSSSSTVKPWEYNPVIVQDGKVFILPTDSKNLIVYDAGTGAEVRRLPLLEFKADEDLAGPRALIAIDGKQAILAGGRFVYCIDWTDPFKQRMDGVVWTSTLPTDVRGRAFATADSVFVCTVGSVVSGSPSPGSLRRIDRRTGKVIQNYPAGVKDWGDGEGPGNLLVVGDHVVVAGPKRVNVYADLALARKRLDDEVAAAPTDPGPRLKYAEVMFVAGKIPDAMAKLDETVALLGGLTGMRPGADRDHLFNDCITFAQKLRAESKPENIDTITRLYDLAAAAADAPGQQVNYRMSRAQFNTTAVQGDSQSDAVRLYQEILSDAKLRGVPLADSEAGGGGTQQAAVVAERLINEVKKVKPSAYAPFETLAAQAMEAAGADPALLKAVAEQYPNAAAAPKALVAAAEAFEGQSNHRLAAHTLWLVSRKYGDSAADRQRVLEGMARNSLAIAGRNVSMSVDNAASRLSAIVRTGGASAPLSKPLTLPGGKELAAAGVTVEDALKAVRSFKAEAAAATLPDFRFRGPPTDQERDEMRKALAAWREAGNDPAKKPKYPEPFLPLNRPEQLAIPEVTALIKPPLDLRQNHSRHDRVVVWSNGALVLYPVGSKEPAARNADLTGTPRNLLWLENNASLLVWSDTELLLLDGATAAKKWSLPLKQLPKVDVVASGGPGDQPVPTENPGVEAGGEVVVGGLGGAMVRRRAVINGRLVNVGAPNVPAPQPGAQPAGESISQVRPVDDKVVVATTAGQLFALRLSGAALAWHTRLAAGSPITRVVATDDFVVARVDDAAATRLVAIDALNGQLVRPLTFGHDTGTTPVNFALAPDGTLVWIQQDRLCAKDLFDPPGKRDLTYEVIAGQNDGASGRPGPNVNIQMDGRVVSPIYAGATAPDQLLITEGRILVVNSNGRYVSIHSLETGKLVVNTQDDGRRAEARLATSAGDGTSTTADWGVGLHVVGSKLYVTSRRNGPLCYNLDKATLLWSGSLDPQMTPNVNYQEPLVGQDYLVIVDRPSPRGPGQPMQPGIAGQPFPNPGPNPGVAPVVPGALNAGAAATNIVRLPCYSRAAAEETGRESGRMNHHPHLRDDAGITEFQGVDGGIYYLTGDKKLHFLQGARAEKPKGK
jgi:outer membrane protein assembly factor BamB